MRPTTAVIPRPLPAFLVAAFVVLAGCAGFVAGPDDRETPTGQTPSPTTQAPRTPHADGGATGDVATGGTLVSVGASGGTCGRSAVPLSLHQSSDANATRVRVAGNVAVPDASYRLADAELTEPSPGNYVFSVRTERDPAKPERDCEAQVGYEATVELPAGDFVLEVRHDGDIAGAFGAGAN